MTPHIPTGRSRRQVLRAGAAGGLAGLRAPRGRGRGVAVFVAALSAAGLTACSSDPTAAEPTAAPAPAATSAGASPTGQVSVLATGLAAPWGIAFLPGGDALVTERDSARILRVPAGAAPRPRSSGCPKWTVTARAACSASRSRRRTRATSCLRLLLDRRTTTGSPGCGSASRRSRSSPASRARASTTAAGWCSVRTAYLYAGTGDASASGRSQDRISLGGKILRMTPDGGRPRATRSATRWSGRTGTATCRGWSSTAPGRLWASEFGQNRFDEINLIQAGQNYGWPIVEGAVRRPALHRPAGHLADLGRLAERGHDRRLAPCTWRRCAASGSGRSRCRATAPARRAPCCRAGTATDPTRNRQEPAELADQIAHQDDREWG